MFAKPEFENWRTTRSGAASHDTQRVRRGLLPRSCVWSWPLAVDLAGGVLAGLDHFEAKLIFTGYKLGGAHHLFGHVGLGFMWARMAVAARAALAAGAGDPAFHEGKLATARYYMARQLPMTAAHLARIRSGADTVMALPAEAF